MRRTHSVLSGLAILCAATLASAIPAAARPAATGPVAQAQANFGGFGAKKGPGTFGLSVADSVYVENGSNPESCSGPVSFCNEWVPDHLLKASLHTSDGFGSASLKSTAELGTLTGSGKAVSAGLGSTSSGASVNIAWEDAFTVTSKTLAPGTPVSFQASIQVAGKSFVCTPSGTAGVSIATIGAEGLLFEELCGSSPPPVLTGIINSQVGSGFPDGVNLYMFVDAGIEYGAGRLAAGPFTVTYHLQPITPGASYITASGRIYP